VSTAPPPPPPASWTPGAPGPSGYYAPAPGTSGFAVAALVLGIFSIGCGGLGFLLAPPILAVIFGNVALDRIAASGGQLKGRGMGIAGIVLGWIGIAIGGAIAIAWLVYGITNL